MAVMQVATPEQAQEVHAFIRNWLATNVGPNIASEIRIIYGAILSLFKWVGAQVGCLR